MAQSEHNMDYMSVLLTYLTEWFIVIRMSSVSPLLR